MHHIGLAPKHETITFSAVKRRIAIVLAVLSAAAILYLTLRPGVGLVAEGWSYSLTSGDAALAELIQNLILFIPLGICLTLAGVRPRSVVLIGALLSFGVEFAQRSIPGRDPSVGDIITNTVSTAIGTLLVVTAPRWLWAPPGRSAWQARATALIAVLAPGDTFVAATWRDSTNVCLRLNALERCDLGYTIGDGWKLIYFPEGARPWMLGLINTLWMMGCVIGVGFWAGRSAGERSGGEK